jgi:uncharacterized surface protein with fasciclin (FAS1) repeats
MKYYVLMFACVIALVFVACRDDQWEKQGKITLEGVDNNLLDLIKEKPELSEFYAALVKTGYDSVLTTGKNFTVLAPVNEEWNMETEDEAVLAKTVGNHIGFDKRMSNDEKLYKELMMVSGKVLRYDELKSFGVGGAQIAAENCDYAASNGVLHVLDKMILLDMNIWEHITDVLAADYAQADYLKNAMDREMDMLRSRPTGVSATGQTLYDTVFLDVNAFLKAVPLNDETKVYTYVIMQDEGFNRLVNKFRPFYRKSTDAETDSMARYNVCSDMVFPGIADIAGTDTLTNIFGYKVALDGAVVGEPYVATNGRVYVMSRSNMHYRERIKPVFINAVEYTNTILEGIQGTTANCFRYGDSKSATGAGNDGKVLYFRLNFGQRDTIKDETGKPLKCTLSDADSTRNTVWGISGESNNFGPESRRINGFVEYKAQVYSGPYEIRYRAYTDSTSSPDAGGEDRRDGHKIVSGTPPKKQKMILYQKFFISMPDAPLLRHGNGGSRPPASATRPVDVASWPTQREVWNVNAIENNYLGTDTAFVTVDTLGIRREKVMRKWRLSFKDNWQPGNRDYDPARPPRVSLPQFVQNPVPGPNTQLMQVPRTGELTMWLTNCTRNDTNQDRDYMWQGPILLDYIKLVPVLPEEE